MAERSNPHKYCNLKRFGKGMNCLPNSILSSMKTLLLYVYSKSEIVCISKL